MVIYRCGYVFCGRRLMSLKQADTLVSLLGNCEVVEELSER